MAIARGSIHTILLLFVSGSFGQTVQEDRGMLKGSLVDILDSSATGKVKSIERTELADLTGEDLRTAPGIVYVLTAEDLAAGGCRFLEDALMLVPSFALGRDVDDVLGFGIRGQWSHEGKLLVLLNGMQLNDASYGICSMGGRIQLDNVARIEVINGPGSVIYGGFAEMGVVNIITKGVEEQTGLVASTSVGIGSNGRDMTSVQVAGANRVGSGTGLDYAAGVCQGTPFTPLAGGPNGASLRYSDSATVETVSGYFRLRKRGFKGQFLANDQFRQVSDQD